MYVKCTRHLDNIYHGNEAGPLVAHNLWSKPTVKINFCHLRRYEEKLLQTWLN